MKVLLIDDDLEILKCLEAALTLKGFATDLFTRPKEALEAYKQEKYDAVVTDLKMQEMDGIEVVRAIKKYNPDAYVIVISGFYDDFKSRMEKVEGVYTFLFKPLDIKELLGALSRIEKELCAASNKK